MPLIRCPRCGQAYSVPGAVAVRLPGAIAVCGCGEWISGSKAAVLARVLEPSQMVEIDLEPFRVPDTPSAGDAEPPAAEAPLAPRSIHIVARGGEGAINAVFTINEHPLWIGRKCSHVLLPQSELSIRHCSISVRGTELVIKDADSHTGTFLDGHEIDEAVIGEGVHLVRIGTALVTIEPAESSGIAVEPIPLDPEEVADESELAAALRARAKNVREEGERIVLVCIDGPLAGQEFDVPPEGVVVGREGDLQIPDEFLSRRHFEFLTAPDGTLRIRDLGSRNGTFLNTLPARDTRVRSGDEISAGVNRFRVETRPGTRPPEAGSIR